MQRFSFKYIKEKWSHAGFQRYFQNTGWMFAARIVCMAISLLATIFIARKLGPTNFGQLNYAVSFIGLFAFISSLGIDNFLYRDLIRYPERKKEILGTALGLKLISGVISALLAIGLAILFTKDDVSKILIFILSVTFLFNPFQIINFEFQARVKSKYPSIVSVLVTLILNILKIIVIMFNKGVIYLSLILVLESILYALFYWFAYEKKIEGSIFEWKFDKEIAIDLLKNSWPLIFTSAFALVYARIDQVLIKNMIDAASVGIYSAGVTIAEVWYFIPGIIIGSLFPAIINAKKTSEDIYYARLKKLSVLLTITAVAVSLIVTVLAPFIIHTIYGSSFIGSIIILQIYVWASVGTFLSILVDNYLVTENYRKMIIFKSFIPMVVNVLLNLLWIPRYGIVGSAYATLISYSLGPISLLFFKETRTKIFKMYTNPAN